jgi:hypothetical protein
MSGLEQILWYIAVPASVVFAIQTILTLLGIVTDHSDADVHHDAITAHAYFPIFTIRNLVVFLMMFGWTGIALVRQFHLSAPLVVLIGILAGLALMFAVAFMFFGIMKLTSGGAAQVDTSIIGVDAKVYLKIPANRGGQGKVIVIFQGSQKELLARTDGPELATGSPVKITALEQDGSVTVQQ